MYLLYCSGQTRLGTLLPYSFSHGHFPSRMIYVPVCPKVSLIFSTTQGHFWTNWVGYASFYCVSTCLSESPLAPCIGAAQNRTDQDYSNKELAYPTYAVCFIWLASSSSLYAASPLALVLNPSFNRHGGPTYYSKL